MPFATHTKKPGPLTRFRRYAGLFNTIAALALLAALTPAGTETQGGSKNQPPTTRTTATAPA